MSIIYSLVSRSYDVVLSEHTEFAGNFQQISRLLMRKMLKKGKSSISYDKYKFHYIFDNNIAYLCMSDNNLRDEIGFSFLIDVKRKFLSMYSDSQIQEFHAYQLIEFNEILQNLIHYYNSNPKCNKGGELINELNETKDIFVENIEKLFDRDEKMNIVAMKSNDLRERAINIHYHAATVKKMEKSKYNKIIMISVVTAVIIFALIIR